MTKDRRLGRGLAALLGNPTEEGAAGGSPGPGTPAGSAVPQPRLHRPTAPTSTTPPTEPASRVRVVDPAEEPDAEAAGDQEAVLQLPVGEIDDNPFQPRRDFGEPEIASLAESLKEHDMLQPVLVRRVGERYQLISGERRLRAAMRAGWKTVPARVREADDRLVAELAIVENLQRKDLNPVEKALSFKRYLEQHGCTQEDLAKRLKLDRSTVANLLRLLELPGPVLEALRRGDVTAGHARALLPLGDESEQISFCARVQREGLSVRDVERMVQEIVQKEDGLLSVVGSTKDRKKASRSDQVALLEQELRRALGTKVEIRQSSRGRGKIVIHFTSHDEFDRLRNWLSDDASQPQADVA